MHTRRVEYRGFHREDGLWDIEGEMLDTKPHGMVIEGEREWAPNEPIHHMHIRVTLDDAFIIQAIEVAMDAFPHQPCPQAQAPMQRTGGRDRWVAAGARPSSATWAAFEGCTHLRELLFNLATAAFQTRSASFALPPDGRPPMHLGQCLAWDFNGPVVEKVYPMFFRWQPGNRPSRCRSGLSRSVHQRGVGQVAEQVANRVALVGRLRHQDAEKIFDGIDKKRGARDATPVVGAHRARHGGHARLGAHRKAQPKAMARRQQVFRCWGCCRGGRRSCSPPCANRASGCR